MSKEILEGIAKDTQGFMGEFNGHLMGSLVNDKLDGAMGDCVDEVMPSEEAGSSEAPLEETEEKEKEEKEEKEEGPKVIAAGAKLMGYRSGRAPDEVEHRYYDLAVWQIAAGGSVVKKVTRRHRELLNFSGALKKELPAVPQDLKFPGKKKMGKKDGEYYSNRYNLMRNYFDTINPIVAVSTSPKFLDFFGLKRDPQKVYNLGIFMSAIEMACEEGGINFGYAFRRAERLGIQDNECEMLKVVAIKKIAKEAVRKMRHEIRQKTPGFVPGAVSNKFVNKADGKVCQLIGSCVEAAWTAMKEAFFTIAGKIGELIDAALDPIKALFMQIAKPVGEKVSELFAAMMAKFKGGDKPEEPSITCQRFPPLGRFMSDCPNGAQDAVKSLLNGIDELDNCHVYVPYFLYNLGNPDWAEYINWLKDLQRGHTRTVIALVDTAWILSRGITESFLPMAQYVDEAAKSWDSEKHEAQVAEAVRLGGLNLAKQYFSLPKNLRRTLWPVTTATGNIVIELAETTVLRGADLLGIVAATWKPTDASDVYSSFVSTVTPLVDALVAESVADWEGIVRDTAQEQITRAFERTLGAFIGALCKALDAVVSAIPGLGDHMRPGQLIRDFMGKMLVKASSKLCDKLSERIHRQLYDPSEEAPDPCDESDIRHLRYRPDIKKAELHKAGDSEPEPASEEEQSDTEETTDAKDAKSDATDATDAKKSEPATEPGAEEAKPAE